MVARQPADESGRPSVTHRGTGSFDIIYTVNSSILQRHLPNAQLILYPDASHGSQYQYPERFVSHASLFLSEGDGRA
jgi:pimeloyl-ACP methyl ester carboxylesterase